MELSVPTGDSGKSSWWPRPGQSSIRAIWDLHGNCGHCHGCEISWIIDRFCCTEFDVSCSITSSAKSMTEICPALHYVVGLGSNAGDSLSLLVEGRRLLVSRSGAAGLMSSALYRTAPVSCASETREFLNAVIFFQSSLAPVEMLDLCQELEVELGRPREHGYHEPRTLDMDILMAGELVLTTPRLTLPHPRAHKRVFVLVPMAEVAPDLKLPNMQVTVSELGDTLTRRPGDLQLVQKGW